MPIVSAPRRGVSKGAARRERKNGDLHLQSWGGRTRTSKRRAKLDKTLGHPSHKPSSGKTLRAGGASQVTRPRGGVDDRLTPPIDLTTRSSPGAHIQTDIFSHGTQARPLAGERPYRRARVSSQCPSGRWVSAVSRAGGPPAQRLEADDERRRRRARDQDPRGGRV